eukprot:115986_1
MKLLLVDKNIYSPALSIPTRIIGLSLSISNAQSLANWLDVDHKLLYNFNHKIRPINFNILIKTSSINNFQSRHISYIKQCYSFLINNGNFTNKQTIIFVSSRRECRRLSSDLIALAAINKCIKNGIGFIHEFTCDENKLDIIKFYKSKAIKILIVEYKLCYNLEIFDLKSTIKCGGYSNNVVLFGTKYHLGNQDGNSVDNYQLCDINQMMSYINILNGYCLILCHTNLKSYYEKFLIYDTYPIESYLDCSNNLEDTLNCEIINNTICSADDAIDFLTWTFYYFRLTKNPNYYNLKSCSDLDLSTHLSE